MTLRSKVNLFSWFLFLLLLNHMSNLTNAQIHDQGYVMKIRMTPSLLSKTHTHGGSFYVN